VIVLADYFTETIVTPGGPPSRPTPAADTIVTTYFAGTRVLVNDGTGVFTRKLDALPGDAAVAPSPPPPYQGNAVAVGDVNGGERPDIFITLENPPEDSQNAGTWPAPAPPHERRQRRPSPTSPRQAPGRERPRVPAGRSRPLADTDGDADLDLLVVSNTLLNSRRRRPPPRSRRCGSTPRTARGTYTSATGTAVARADGSDSLQSEAVAVGDLTGDGRADIFLVSAQAPNSGGSGARVL